MYTQTRNIDSVGHIYIFVYAYICNKYNQMNESVRHGKELREELEGKKGRGNRCNSTPIKEILK